MANEFKEKRDYDSNGRLEYYGKAEPGTHESEAKWMIKKYSYGGISETGRTYPNGSNANLFIWNRRKTYKYR